VRNLRNADKAIKFLEELKSDLNDEEKQIVSDTINIIVNKYTKGSKNDFQTLK